MTELRMIAVSDLKPVDWNPRKHLPDLIEKIKRNIEDIGWLEPCVANKDLTLLGGHQRLKAAIKSGMTEVPCFIVDIPKDKEKLANLSLNKLVGEWDTKKLDLVLEDLDIEDLELAGFEKIESVTLQEPAYFEDEKSKLLLTFHESDRPAVMESLAALAEKIEGLAWHD